MKLMARGQERTLAENEAIIDRGIETFIEVGFAFADIRDRRQYREVGYSDFDGYTRDRWGLSRRQVDREIDAAKTTFEKLGPMGLEITNERQARELLQLRDNPEAQAEAWREVATERGIAHVTAERLREAVDRRLAGAGDTTEPTTPLAVHFSSDSPEWYTPPHIVERVCDVLGAIDLDPCSNSHEHPNVPAAQHFTAEDDGLTRSWQGRIYMNPPYGRDIEPWVRKLADEYAAGRTTEAIALVPARTDTQWFRVLRDFPVCFVDGRLRFSGHENSAPFPSALVYLGPNVARFVGGFCDVGDAYQRIEA